MCLIYRKFIYLYIAGNSFFVINKDSMYRTIFLFAILGFGISSCDDDTLLSPSEPSGEVVGFISLINEFGAPLNDYSGVLVTILDSLTEKTAVTDQQGKFTLSDVPRGSYDITFEKNGYGVEKLFGVQVSGGTQPLVIHDIAVHQLNTTNITTFDIIIGQESVWSPPQVQVTIALDPFATKRRSFIVFVHTSNTVSDKNYRFSKVMSINQASGFYNEPLFDFEFLSQFEVGTKLYFVAYSLSTGQEGYFDPDFGLKIYSTVGIPTAIEEVTWEGF